MKQATNVSRKWRTAFIILGLISILLLLAITILMAGDKLQVVWTAKNQTVAVRSQVCSEDMIYRYNNAASSPAGAASAIAGITKEIEALPNYVGDGNCVFMALQHYLEVGDKEKVKNLLAALRVLNNKGKYADGSIDSLSGLQSLDLDAETILNRPADWQPAGEG